MTARIGLVIATSERGGFSAVVAEAHDLVTHGVEVHVLSPPGPRISQLPSEARHTPLRARSRELFRSTRQVRHWVRAVRPHVVHVHGRASGVTARVALVGTEPRVVYTPHGVSIYPRPVPRLADRIAQRLLRRRTDLYLVVGEAEEREFAREHGFGGTPTARMPNLVDPPPARDASNVAPGAPFILVPGAYNPRKRFADVVNVADAAPPGWTIRFLGHTEGGGEEQLPLLEKLAREHGVQHRVSFEPESSDLWSEFADAALVVFPSETEGLPITALEALAAGAPLAWSDIAGHREIFGDEGASFPVGDLDAIARLLQDPDGWPALRPNPERAAQLFARHRKERQAGVATLIALADAAASADG